MRIEYVSPFTEACRIVFKQTIGIDVEIGETLRRPSPYPVGDISIIVGLSGDVQGQAVLSLSHDIAAEFASLMLGGMEITELDDMSRSSLSELMNIVLGATVGLFAARSIQVDISPPTLLMGASIHVSLEKAETVCVPLYWDNRSKSIELDISIASSQIVRTP